MASILEGSLARQVFAAFRGKLLKGYLRRMVSLGGEPDEYGDVTVSVFPQVWSLEGFEDTYDDRYRAVAGIPETDVRVSVFAQSLPAGISPRKDDMVGLIRNGVTNWYQLRTVQTDPAQAMWTCQAFAVPEPSP